VAPVFEAQEASFCRRPLRPGALGRLPTLPTLKISSEISSSWLLFEVLPVLCVMLY